MWFFKKRRVKRRTRGPKSAKHYQMHKEFARTIITDRIIFLNQAYQYSYGRIAIKNQKRCWGSCSAKGNLNFNYRIIFLPEVLMDYIIVHELCHLKELNHSKEFWKHVERGVPSYQEHRQQLKKMIQIPPEGFPESVFAAKQSKIP